MKKFLYIALTLLVMMLSEGISSAQGWEITKENGANPITIASYSEGTDVFVLSTDNVYVTLKSASKFVFKKNVVQVVAYFYLEGELMYKRKLKFLTDYNISNYCMLTDNDMCKAIKYHIETLGDIRIVAPKDDGSNFDITVKMNEDLGF